jgi:CheY-like chemotaxis protein
MGEMGSAVSAQRPVNPVVDDEVVCEVLTELLEGEGHQVVTARDGPEALQPTRAHQPDLILLDLHIPKLEGVAFCPVYREAGGRSPIILR